MEEKYMFYRLKILTKRSTELVKKSDELFEMIENVNNL